MEEITEAASSSGGGGTIGGCCEVGFNGAGGNCTDATGMGGPTTLVGTAIGISYCAFDTITGELLFMGLNGAAAVMGGDTMVRVTGGVFSTGVVGAATGAGNGIG